MVRYTFDICLHFSVHRFRKDFASLIVEKIEIREACLFLLVSLFVTLSFFLASLGPDIPVLSLTLSIVNRSSG